MSHRYSDIRTFSYTRVSHVPKFNISIASLISDKLPPSFLPISVLSPAVILVLLGRPCLWESGAGVAAMSPSQRRSKAHSSPRMASRSTSWESATKARNQLVVRWKNAGDALAHKGEKKNEKRKEENKKRRTGTDIKSKSEARVAVVRLSCRLTAKHRKGPWPVAEDYDRWKLVMVDTNYERSVDETSSALIARTIVRSSGNRTPTDRLFLERETRPRTAARVPDLVQLGESPWATKKRTTLIETTADRLFAKNGYRFIYRSPASSPFSNSSLPVRGTSFAKPFLFILLYN